MCSVQIIAYRADVVLLDDFHKDGAILLMDFFQNSVLCLIPFHSRFVMRHFFAHQLHRVIMFHILFQQEVKRLADARCFYPFHFDTLLKK